MDTPGLSLAPTLPSLPEIDEAQDDDHGADSDADGDGNLAPPAAKPVSPSLAPPLLSLWGISAASAEPSPSPGGEARGPRVVPAGPDGEAVADDDDVTVVAAAAAAAAAATAVAAIVVGGGKHPGALKNCRKLLFSSFWSADASALDDESSIAMKAAGGGVSWVSRVAYAGPVVLRTRFSIRCGVQGTGTQGALLCVVAGWGGKREREGARDRAGRPEDKNICFFDFVGRSINREKACTEQNEASTDLRGVLSKGRHQQRDEMVPAETQSSRVLRGPVGDGGRMYRSV